MTEDRIHDGRDLTRSELETLWRLINEVNIEAIIEDGDIIIQAVCDGAVIEPIARCDLRRLAAYSADFASQRDDDEASVYALAGLFSKCAQIVLNEAEPSYEEREGAERLGGVVRLFAGNDRENPPEDIHAA